MKLPALMLAVATLAVPSVALAEPVSLQASAALPEDRSAPLERLIAPVELPYEMFTLENGLRVIVHTDRRAPIVAVGVWYDVGSKNEPAGKTGFAHLFEHLMFNGSENAPGDFFAPLKAMGATDYNGTTYFDRTNYYETVPLNALERTLFLESDRMGWLTGAITQDVLDTQRGVVQNEKRQGDNAPYGLVQYSLTEGLYPAGHPYGHTPIGSMADLDAASLDDVLAWFRDHYGPNNAVLSLAGDIDAATARPLVEKYFGAIARGPRTTRPDVAVPTLRQAKTEVLSDRVATTLILRSWTVPGLNDADSVALDIAAGVLGGLASSRLDETLVRGENLAVSVSASNSSLAQAGTFSIQAMVKPGIDAERVSRRMDEILQDFLNEGPSPDEVRRVATGAIVDAIEGFESVSEKSATLAQGELYSDQPDYYRRWLFGLAAVTPERVRNVATAWLARPALTVIVKPGARPPYVEADIAGTDDAAAASRPVFSTNPVREPMPQLGEPVALEVPVTQRDRLSNGVEIIYARQSAVPLTRVSLGLDAGSAADPRGGDGTHALVLSLLDDGTGRLDAMELARMQERLGARIETGSTFDRTRVTLLTPSANLAAAVDLFADVVLHPRFDDESVSRERDTALAGIAQTLASPSGLANKALGPLLYGAGTPYARALSPGAPDVVADLKPADLRAFHRAWFRPEKAKLFVTSDRPLSEVRAVLEVAFGSWQVTGESGVKSFGNVGVAGPAGIVLLDRPDSPQSYILGGFATDLDSRGDTLAAETANEVLGGDFLSRLNMNLREDKHWSYGVRGAFRVSEHAMPYTVSAPVQADRTGDAIAEIRAEMASFLGGNPMTAAELARTVTGEIRSLPGTFANSRTVLAAMQRNELLNRPDNYYAGLADRYEAVSVDAANAALRAALDIDAGVWVVVGDARVVLPQLKGLGLPVTVVEADDASLNEAGQNETE